MNETLTIGIPLIVIIAGILFNRQDTTSLRSEMNSLRNEMNARFDQVNIRFDGLQRDMNHFYEVLGSHDARIENLEKNPRRS